MTAPEVLRRRKDWFFKTNPHSPLTARQREAFGGLLYYPLDPSLRYELPLEEFPEKREVWLQTSTGDQVCYHRWGRIRFEVGGQPVALVIYAVPGTASFFLPFKDATSGIETYAGGRYLEIDSLPDGRVVVDFNLAYNPYCAYNPHWSCPIPPDENRLPVPIRAGERLPVGEWVEDRE